MAEKTQGRHRDPSRASRTRPPDRARRAPPPAEGAEDLVHVAEIASEGTVGIEPEVAADHRRAAPVVACGIGALTGRKVSNLSRTLKTMSQYGLVKLAPGARARSPPRYWYAKSGWICRSSGETVTRIR